MNLKRSTPSAADGEVDRGRRLRRQSTTSVNFHIHRRQRPVDHPLLGVGGREGRDCIGAVFGVREIGVLRVDGDLRAAGTAGWRPRPPEGQEEEIRSVCLLGSKRRTYPGCDFDLTGVALAGTYLPYRFKGQYLTPDKPKKLPRRPASPASIALSKRESNTQRFMCQEEEERESWQSHYDQDQLWTACGPHSAPYVSEPVKVNQP